jgi:uncharacterized protein YggT (Ycf19 family)
VSDYERTVVREEAVDDPVVARDRTVTKRYRSGPTAGEVIRRFVMLLFGVLQALLILRIILLLLVANPGNDIVALVFNVTQPFVEPFLNMFALNRVTADQGSVLDVAAIVALIGWTLVEMLILAAIRIFSRRPADAV